MDSEHLPLVGEISPEDEIWGLLSDQNLIYLTPLIVILNSLRPSDTYMRRQPRTSLFQIMACLLFGAKPLSEPMLEYWTLWNKLQWNLNQNLNIFIDENVFENDVCEIAAILSRPQCVKCYTQYSATCWILQLDMTSQHGSKSNGIVCTQLLVRSMTKI